MVVCKTLFTKLLLIHILTINRLANIIMQEIIVLTS